MFLLGFGLWVLGLNLSFALLLLVLGLFVLLCLLGLLLDFLFLLREMVPLERILIHVIIVRARQDLVELFLGTQDFFFAEVAIFFVVLFDFFLARDLDLVV